MKFIRKIRKHSTSKQTKTNAHKYLVILVWAVVVIAVAVGIYIRLWYIFNFAINSDEAITGLMAHQFLSTGHLMAFFWGNTGYGGTAEAVITAGLFAVFGQTVAILKSTDVILAVISSVLVAKIAYRLVKNHQIAILAGALVWVAPTISIVQSTAVGGFRGITIASGLAMILFVLKILDGQDGLMEFIGLGLVAGIGWWSSPEMIYFLVPAVLLTIGAIVKNHGAGLVYWVKRIIISLVAFFVGSLPWWWANFKTNFESLKPSAFKVPAGSPDYSQRVHLFFKYSLPMLAGLRGDGPVSLWIFRRDVCVILLVIVVAALTGSIVVAIKRRDRSLAIAAGVVTFPFVLALSPATWFWNDGRYVIFAPPLAVLLLVVGVTGIGGWVEVKRLGRKHRSNILAPFCMSLIVLVFVLVSAKGLYITTNHTFSARALSLSRTASSPTLQSIKELENDGIQYGYGEYWVAYTVDFLSKEHLTITGYDISRSASIEASVVNAKYQAYLFVKPNNAIAETQFGSTMGLAGLSEQQFIATLQQKNTQYRLANTNLFNVVIVTNPK